VDGSASCQVGPSVPRGPTTRGRERDPGSSAVAQSTTGRLTGGVSSCRRVRAVVYRGSQSDANGYKNWHHPIGTLRRAKQSPPVPRLLCRPRNPLRNFTWSSLTLTPVVAVHKSSGSLFIKAHVRGRITRAAAPPPRQISLAHRHRRLIAALI
jgi:hypothetical protein